VTTEWYANFVDKDDDTVQDIILAANFLDIKELLALSCAKMGSVIRGLTIPEFRKRFNIENDFTPEEESEPFDEAKLAELAEEYEKDQEEKNKKEKELEKEKEGEEEEKKQL
jgi:S-phase kinase-associated protein 1